MKYVIAIVFLMSGVLFSALVYAVATCPAPNAKQIIKQGNVYSAKTIGDPALTLHTPKQYPTHDALYKFYKVDREENGLPTKFYAMTLSKVSPYFLSCAYDKGSFVLSTIGKNDFYDTDKTCHLIGRDKGVVQHTSIGDVCMSDGRHSSCQLTCN